MPEIVMGPDYFRIVVNPARTAVASVAPSGIHFVEITPCPGKGTRPMDASEILRLCEDGLEVINTLKTKNNAEWADLAYNIVLLAAGELAPSEQLNLQARIRTLGEPQGRVRLARLLAGARDLDSMPTVEAIMEVVQAFPADFLPVEMEGMRLLKIAQSEAITQRSATIAELEALKTKCAAQEARIAELEVPKFGAQEARIIELEVSKFGASSGPARGDHLITLSEHNRVVGTLEAKEGQLRHELRVQNEKIERLQAFKTYVHSALTSWGFPENPPGSHAAQGCRIGQRLELVREALKKGIEAPLDLDKLRTRCANLDRQMAESLASNNALIRELNQANERASVSSAEAAGLREEVLELRGKLVNREVEPSERASALPALSVKALEDRLLACNAGFTEDGEVRIGRHALFGLMNALRRGP